MKKNSIITLLVFFTLLYIMASCTSSNTQLVKLQQIDRMMEKNPQAAYDSLLHSQKEMQQVWTRKIEMKYLLLKAKAENKLYLQMPTDSSFQKVVDYYDDKGNSNEQMEAHYLMGCIYRDQNEAPKAMLWYNKAIECADTLSKGCDYITLYSIYGQMADIYSKQYLHQEAIKAYQNYSYYAAHANNREDYILGLSNTIPEYYALGDTLKAVNLAKKYYTLNNKYGLTQNAALTLPILIYALLAQEKYQQAHYYMNIFETQSGIYGKNGNIQSGYEHYYRAKGIYYLGTNQLKEAELFFRKLDYSGFKYEAAHGLLSIYRTKQNNDSIKKYSILCEQEMDKILNGTQANAVIQATALFNYTKLQQEVEAKKSQQERNKYITAFICLGTIFCIISLSKRYRLMRKKMKADLKKVSDDYIQTFKELKNAHKDLEILQENAGILIKKKQQEIISLQIKLQKYKEKYDCLDLTEKKIALMNSSIVQHFKTLAIPKKICKSPQQEDWDELVSVFQQCQPLLLEKIKCCKLSTQESRVCILTYLGMDNTDISILINTTTKVISNAKQKANKKLYNENTASTLYVNLTKE